MTTVPMFFLTSPLYFDKEGHEVPPFEFDPGAAIFTDGLCFLPAHRSLARAGWVAVQVGSEGRLMKGIRRPVPGSFAQSASAG